MSALHRNVQYVSWLVSDTSKGLALTLFAFAIPLIALIVTGDPAQAGVIGGAGATVRVVLMLFGGVLADRHRRITLMIIGALTGAALSIVFTVLAASAALTFSSLLVCAVLLAARSALFDTAGEAALKEIVSDQAMGRAMAMNQARDAALQLAGGPIGGLLLAVGGWLVGAVMATAHLLSAVTAWLIPRLPGDPEATPSPETAQAAPPRREPDRGDAVASRSAMLHEIKEGFSWLFSRPDLSGVLVILTLINLGINAVITTAVYALQQDGHSPSAIGWISAGIGAAMLLGALCAGAIVSRVGAGMLMLVGLLALTAGAAAVIWVREPLGLVLVLAVPGLTLAPLNAAMGGYAMVATPSALVGRVNAASGAFSMGAMPLAPLIAGFGLSFLGRTPTVLIGVAVCVAATVLALSNRSLRSLPAEPGWAAHAKKYQRTLDPDTV